MLKNILKDTSLIVILCLLIIFILIGIFIKLNSEGFNFFIKFLGIIILVFRNICLNIKGYRISNILTVIRKKGNEAIIKEVFKAIFAILILLLLELITNVTIIINLLDNILRFENNYNQEEKDKEVVVFRNYIDMCNCINSIRDVLETEILVPIVSTLISICLYIRSRSFDRGLE